MFRSVLFGDTPRFERWGALVAAVFLGSLAWFALVNTQGSNPVHDALWTEGYVLLLLVIIAGQASVLDGLFLSWLVAFAAVVGTVLNYGGVGVTGTPPDLPELLGLAFGAGAVGALAVGTAGFVLGRVVASVRE